MVEIDRRRAPKVEALREVGAQLLHQLERGLVGHERRAPMPGYHIGVALLLTRGRHYTFPVLELDGRRIGDSTAIIAALEERYPQPPLYPSDPAERERALELE